MEIIISFHGDSEPVEGIDKSKEVYEKAAQKGVIPQIGEMVFFHYDDIRNRDDMKFEEKHGFYLEDGFVVKDISYGITNNGNMVITLFS